MFPHNVDVCEYFVYVCRLLSFERCIKGLSILQIFQLFHASLDLDSLVLHSVLLSPEAREKGDEVCVDQQKECKEEPQVQS